jgi:thiol-disulfide isomerase/thioredoxin
MMNASLQGGYTPDESEFIVTITRGASQTWVFTGLIGQNKQAFTAEALGEFLENVLSTDVNSPKMYMPSTDHTQPFYKGEFDENGETIPARQTSILTVTGDTFDGVVTRGNRDVLMMFAAPWCVHCIRFLPKYDSIAQKHANSKHGPIIAHMDADLNIVGKDFAIMGYPSFFWIPANGGSPTRYWGDYMEAKHLEDFIQSMQKRSNEASNIKQRQGAHHLSR